MKLKQFISDIDEILDYLWSDEETSYQEYPNEDHIFKTLQRVNDFLDILRKLV